MEFKQLERITEECIGKAILKFCNNTGVNITECRGQCYDGAGNMQSQKKCAASNVSEESPTEIVTHCCSHNLNLLLEALRKLPEAEDILESCINFLQQFSKTGGSSRVDFPAPLLQGKKNEKCQQAYAKPAGTNVTFLMNFFTQKYLSFWKPLK